MSPPIFITVRDRVSQLRLLVAWLEGAGADRIVLLDNDSAYEPLLDYLERSPHEVIYLHRNLGPRAIWYAGLVPSEPFVVTDPDVLPIDDCPLDAVSHLAGMLRRYPAYTKAGLGLYLDDVPSSMPSLAFERRLVAPSLSLGNGAYASMIDTTFALYRANCSRFRFQAIRCGWPYQARHPSWYGGPITAEDRFYLDRARRGNEGSSWATAYDEAGGEW